KKPGVLTWSPKIDGPNGSENFASPTAAPIWIPIYGPVQLHTASGAFMIGALTAISAASALPAKLVAITAKNAVFATPDKSLLFIYVAPSNCRKYDPSPG